MVCSFRKVCTYKELCYASLQRDPYPFGVRIGSILPILPMESIRRHDLPLKTILQDCSTLPNDTTTRQTSRLSQDLCRVRCLGEFRWHCVRLGYLLCLICYHVSNYAAYGEPFYQLLLNSFWKDISKAPNAWLRRHQKRPTDAPALCPVGRLRHSVAALPSIYFLLSTPTVPPNYLTPTST